MADTFHFFTDIDLCNIQTIGQSYGPVHAFEETKFRLGDIHSATSDPNAYAICSGTLFIQEDSTNSNLLNIALKPLFQPKNNLPHIEYYLYRGIKRNSLVSTNGIEIAPIGTNDLVNSVWDSQNKRNTSYDVSQQNPIGTTTDTPPIDLLGLNYGSTATSPFQLLDSETIDKVFLNLSSEYQLPNVMGGNSIGKFDAASFGIQIIFESIENIVTAGLLRSNDSVVEIAPLSGGEDQPTTFGHWNNKEIILSCIDPAAFFGSFYGENLMIKNSMNQWELITGDIIYSQCLSLYFNKNKVYLDIRNEFNRSLNYFGNYGNEILISFDNSSYTSINYYRSNWPILIIDTDFLPGNTTDNNTIRVKFPKGDNNYPILFKEKCYSSENFPEELMGIAQFKLLEHSNTSDFSLIETEIKLPNFIESDTTPISNFIKLTILKWTPGVLNQELEGVKFISRNQFDNLFNPLKMKIKWGNENVNQVQIFHDKIFVNSRSINGISYIGKRGLFKGSNGDFVFFSYSINTLDGYDPIYSQNSLSSIGETEMSASSYFSYNFNVTIENVKVEIDNEVVYIENTINLYQGYQEGKGRLKDANSFSYLVLKSSEFNDVITIINDPVNGFILEYPIYLGANLVQNGYDDSSQIYYQIFELHINGYYLNTSENVVEIKTINTEIRLYRSPNITTFN